GRLVKVDNVFSEKAIKECRTLEGMGITPEGVDAVLPSYLLRYRVAGQYT
ncbi:complex I NDUFA9 subunit family protein, partial [Brucella oryzae]